MWPVWLWNWNFNLSNFNKFKCKQPPVASSCHTVWHMPKGLSGRPMMTFSITFSDVIQAPLTHQDYVPATTLSKLSTPKYKMDCQNKVFPCNIIPEQFHELQKFYSISIFSFWIYLSQWFHLSKDCCFWDNPHKNRIFFKSAMKKKMMEGEFTRKLLVCIGFLGYR